MLSRKNIGNNHSVDHKWSVLWCNECNLHLWYKQDKKTFFKRATQQIHLTKLRLWLECDQNSFKTSSRVSVSLKSLFCLFDYFLWSVNFFFSSHRFYHHTGVRIYSVAVLFIILFPFLLSPFCVCKDKQRQKNTFCKLLSDFQNCTISSRIFFFQDTEPVLFAITALYVLTPCSHLCTGHQHQLLTCHCSHSVLTRGLNRWLVYTNMHTHTNTHTAVWSTPRLILKILQGTADGFNNKWYHWSSERERGTEGRAADEPENTATVRPSANDTSLLKVSRNTSEPKIKIKTAEMI